MNVRTPLSPCPSSPAPHPVYIPPCSRYFVSLRISGPKVDFVVFSKTQTCEGNKHCMAVSAAYAKRWGEIGSRLEFAPAMHNTHGTFVLACIYALKKPLSFFNSRAGSNRSTMFHNQQTE